MMAKVIATRWEWNLTVLLVLFVSHLTRCQDPLFTVRLFDEEEIVKHEAFRNQIRQMLKGEEFDD